MKETKKYKLLTTIRYLGDAFFYPFFALYLKSIGLIENKIGFILSISPILSILLNPIYSYLCKEINKTKTVLEIITILEGIIIILISFSSNFYLVSFLTILLAIFGSCHYGLLDSITSFYACNTNINYSSIRIFGSCAYIVGTTLGGYVTKFFDFKVCFIIAGILFIICGVIYKSLLKFDNEEIVSKKVDIKNTLKYLFKNKSFIFFIIFYCLLMGTQATTDSFFSLYLESRGISSDQYGLIYSFFVLFEVVTLFILNKTFKESKTKLTYPLLFVSSILLSIRMLVNFLDLNIYVVIILSSFRGIGYAFILHTAFSYVQKIVKKEAASVAVMMLTFFYSIYLALWNNINGIIIKTYSYNTFYFVSLVLAVFAIALSLFKLFKKESTNEY